MPSQVGSRYFELFGSRVPLDIVDITLRDTLNEVFADPVVKNTVIEEVMRKLKPRPPYAEARFM